MQTNAHIHNTLHHRSGVASSGSSADKLPFFDDLLRCIISKYNKHSLYFKFILSYKNLRIPPKKDVSILMLVDPWTWCNICKCSEVSYYNPSHWCFYIYPTRRGSMCIWMLWIGIAPPVVTLTLETYTKKRSNKNTDTDVSTQVWSV